MSAGIENLWHYTKQSTQLSPDTLLQLVVSCLCDTTQKPDERSAMLIRESLDALAKATSRQYIAQRVEQSPSGERLRAIWLDEPEKIGFPTLSERLMEPTTPQVLVECLRDVSARIREPVSVVICGSSALIFKRLLVRATDDIDFIDEVPGVLRNDHVLLAEIRDRHRLSLAHAASHYLPSGWDRRTWLLGQFRQLTVKVIDPIDLLVGKLFSRRSKDFRDVRDCWNLIDQLVMRQRIAQDTKALRESADSTEAAQRNWYVLTGEEQLPSLEASA